jgi:hypothetical protein
MKQNNKVEKLIITRDGDVEKNSVRPEIPHTLPTVPPPPPPPPPPPSKEKENK